MKDIEQGWTDDPFFKQTKSKDIILLDYGETPYFLRGNPYITSGYRAYLSFRKCLTSLFQLNNETMNIWTHLLGFVIFFILFIYSNSVTIPSSHGGYIDHAVFTCFLLFYQFCMLCSAGYHMFNCHSEKIYHIWLSLDLAGISLALCGCYIPSVYYAFYCQPNLQAIYMTIVGAMSLVALLLQFHPQYFTSLWANKRLTSFGVIGMFGMIPSLHWICIHGGFTQIIVQVFFPKVVTMYILGGLAIVIYAFKFPECVFPGRLNFIGASHQCWHIIIVIAFCWWYKASVQFFNFRQEYGCMVENVDLFSMRTFTSTEHSPSLVSVSITR
ncbi:progestin and adipoQ receptor family member 3-like [Dendronephthya gigantea]|uniref:progestin and adipoQ receptor family member 3-like n=1 Tax=Dendronephthya gigantea TaxID=151771 RepID=UPI00106DC9A8|nr:progestin and adipoQ receptor family member 3-like [Dendronephthya gigantea]